MSRTIRLEELRIPFEDSTLADIFEKVPKRRISPTDLVPTNIYFTSGIEYHTFSEVPTSTCFAVIPLSTPLEVVHVEYIWSNTKKMKKHQLQTLYTSLFGVPAKHDWTKGDLIAQIGTRNIEYTPDEFESGVEYALR